jgi:hypothetical protein
MLLNRTTIKPVANKKNITLRGNESPTFLTRPVSENVFYIKEGEGRGGGVSDN